MKFNGMLKVPRSLTLSMSRELAVFVIHQQVLKNHRNIFGDDIVNRGSGDSSIRKDESRRW